MLTYQIVEAISKETGLSEKDVDKALMAFVRVLRDGLTQRGERMTIRNLGTFKMIQNVGDEEMRDLIFTPLPE